MISAVCSVGRPNAAQPSGIAEFAGLENDERSRRSGICRTGKSRTENDGLENDGVEQEQTYILHTIK